LIRSPLMTLQINYNIKDNNRIFPTGSKNQQHRHL
jgi:hypothetical protein